MGNYISQSDLEIPEDVLTELTDDNDISIVDTDVITRVISDAEATFDGYVGVKYAVPLTDGLNIAVRCCRTIAKYYLYQRRDVLPENLEKEHANVISFLRDVSKGAVSLGVDPAPARNSSQDVEFELPDRIFSRDKLKGM